MRQAARQLFRSPGFATLTIVMLAIGIGINTGMLALMDALLFRPPLHVAEPANVFRVEFTVLDQGEPELADRTHYPNIVDLEASGAFAAVAGYRATSVSVGRGAEAVVASAMLVSDRFFEVLRPAPHLGGLALHEGVVISFAFWQRRLASDPAVVGRSLTLDGRPYVVSGVVPAGFNVLGERPIDLWLPLEHATVNRIAPAGWRANRERAWLFVIGRLRPGVTAAAAAQQAGTVLRSHSKAAADDEPTTAVRTAAIVPGREGTRTLEGRVSLWLAGVSALVLLMACANVANLVGARLFAKRRDGFIRLDARRVTGASHLALARRDVPDRAPRGVGRTAAVVRAAQRRGRVPLQRAPSFAQPLGWPHAPPHRRKCGRGLPLPLCRLALAAAFYGARVFSPLGAGVARSAGRSRRMLLAVQACLCLVLLFVAGLFAMSLRRAEALDLGVDIDRTIQVTIGAARPGTESRDLFDRAREALAAHPDVQQVALAEASPFRSGTAIGPWTADRDWTTLWSQREPAYSSVLGPGFFATVSARSFRGRDFTDADRAGAPRVAIINAPLAAHLWPGGDALGQCMFLETEGRDCVRVVGILGGVWKMSAIRRDRMAVYLPLAQVPGASPGVLFVKPRANVQAVIPQVRSVVQTLRDDLPAASIVVMRDVVAPEFRPWRLGTNMFAAFAAVALLIATIGLYGVVAAATALRVKEIGVRMALGARRGHVVRTVAAEGVPSVMGGLVAGAGLIAIASRWFGGVLFETSPRDPAVIVGTAALLLAVSVLALSVPTIRALRTNLATILRAD